MKDRKLRRRVSELEKLVGEQKQLIDHLDKVNQMHVEAEELSRQERLAADQMLSARQRLQELAEVERREADRIIVAQQELHKLTVQERQEAADINSALMEVQALSVQERQESEDQLRARTQLEDLSVEEIRQRDGILEEILNIGRQINRLLPEGELFRLILVSAMERLGADRGAVMIQNGSRQEIRFSRGFGKSPDESSILAAIRAAQIRRQGGPGAAPSGKLTAIVSTLTRESRPVGALFLELEKEDSCFRRMDLEFLDLFAAQASLALSNAQLYDSIRSRNRELRRALMLKNNFIEHLSDDLRKPLSKLHSLFEKEDALDRKEAEKITGWLMRVLDRVLSIAALNQENEEMFSHRISIVDIANVIFSNLEQEIKKLDLTTEVTTRGTIPAFEGNRDIFNTILDELICNAVVYNRPGGFVRVVVSSEGHRLKISISDNGIGIKRSDKSKVFNRFYRSEASYHHYSRGAGLGLYIVRSFVENYGGSIALTSEKDCGTEVVISLPV